jgi:lecithin:cholesterol acyltransferase
VIFVPGLSPKPPAEAYRAQLLRVLVAALERMRPRAARILSERPEEFVLVAWTHLFYALDRDIALDLAGIDRLLTQEATADDRREIASWSRRLDMFARIVGDAVPIFGRLANSMIRAQLDDVKRYQLDTGGIGTRIRALVRAALESAWAAGARVLLIGHSLGSVICYDTLWDLSRERGADARIDLFMTLGSPLATHVIRRGLRGVGLHGADAYPRNIARWVNLTARADTTALHPRLAPRFREMLELGLVGSIEDYGELENCFRGAYGLNTHEAYGYLFQSKVAEIVGEFIERD